MNDQPALNDLDIAAIRDAVALLDESDFRIVDIDGIDRQTSADGRVRWTMTVETDARTTSLADYDLGDR